MHERYQYPPLQIIFPYAYILIIPAMGILSWFMLDPKISEVGFFLTAFYWCFMLAFAGAIIGWIWNNLSVRIELNDFGLVYHSIIKKEAVPWSNIVDIEHKILYERHGWHDNPQTGNDLLIKLLGGKKLKIFGVVYRTDGKDGGITEFENAVRSKVNLPKNDPEQQKRNQYQRELRLCLIAGILCFVFGIIYMQHPLPPSKEKLGFITSAIGVSADGLLLLIIGAGLAAWSFSRIRSKSS